MSEKQPEITGHEGEAGSFVVVDGKRVPNTESVTTLTPDDPGYAEAKKRLEARSVSAAPAPAATKGGK